MRWECLGDDWWWDGRFHQSRRVKTKLHAHTKPGQAILVRLVCCLNDAPVRRQGLDQISINRRSGVFKIQDARWQGRGRLVW